MLTFLGDCMKFGFTQIDRDDPSHECFFIIFVDNNNCYQLVETIPSLPKSSTDSYLTSLNENNNISAFVVNMRKAFVQLFV
jgi:uncharacterized pyridoxamine 5'-phosphate oxidase family protein